MASHHKNVPDDRAICDGPHKLTPQRIKVVHMVKKNLSEPISR